MLDVLNMLKFLLQGRCKFQIKMYTLGSSCEEKVKEVVVEGQK
jgi:hypothetical protein